jgi:hypothetical protein
MPYHLPIHYNKAAGKRVVGNPAEDTPAFLQRELSLVSLADMLSICGLPAQGVQLCRALSCPYRPGDQRPRPDGPAPPLV